MHLRNIPYQWLVAIVFVAGLFMELLDTTVVYVALPTLGREFDVGHTALEWVVTGYLLSLAVWIPASGWLGDRWSKQKIGATGVLLGGLGLSVLLFSGGGFWHMVLFVILFSFADGINSVTWALVGDLFGRQHFASIRGWVGMFQSFASMPAAVFTGWVYDQTHSYTYALFPFLAMYGLAALFLWKVTPPKQSPCPTA